MTVAPVPGEPVLRCDKVSVRARSGNQILDSVDLVVPTGAVHAVIGESGSGKTTLALTALGHLRPGLRQTGGAVRVAGIDVMALGARALREHRRTAVAWLSQDPALSLTPHLTVRELITEIMSRSDDDLVELLRNAGLPADASLLGRRPHEVSGGQRRRIALARALATRPRLLILDEPTAGLDSAAIDEQASTLKRLTAAGDLTVLLVTHDLRFAAAIADSISVMSEGRMVETSAAQQLFAQPRTAAATALIDAVRLTDNSPREFPDVGGAPVVQLASVDVTAPDGSTVVRGLDLTLNHGEGLAIVGRSGIGKSTLAHVLVGRRPVDAGTITWRAGGQCVEASSAPAKWFTRRSTPELRRVQLIPQDPTASLNPALTVRTQLARAVHRAHPRRSRRETSAAVAELLAAVGLSPGVLSQRPSTLSGGQAQRVAIARALAHEPQLLICDESTSALDPTVQRGVLDTLNSLRRSRGLALIIITHAPEVADYTSQRTITLHARGHTLDRATPSTERSIHA